MSGYNAYRDKKHVATCTLSNGCLRAPITGRDVHLVATSRQSGCNACRDGASGATPAHGA